MLTIYLILSFVCVIVNGLDFNLFHDVLMPSALDTCDHRKNLNIDVTKTLLYFYDFKNNVNLSFPLHQAAEGLAKNYKLDFSKKIIFFVSGFVTNINDETNDLMRKTFRDVPNTYYMIIDHSAYTGSEEVLPVPEDYERAVKHAYYIGKSIGDFLAQLKRKGFPAKNIHAIGHSLGAQMLGYAGEEFIKKTGVKIWRITGLDPAGPCFAHSSVNDQLRSGLADYVEVYHCNSGGYGTRSVLGDIDFLFNKNGEQQPSCGLSICHHEKCLNYWAFTVHRKDAFKATKCSEYREFESGRCARNEVTIAGYGNPGDATGSFYVPTEGYGIE